LASDSSEIGEKNFQFNNDVSRKHSRKSTKKNLNWDQVCWNVSLLQRQTGGPVSRNIVMNVLGLDEDKDYERFQKGTQTRDCILTEYGGIVRHDDQLHNVSNLYRKFGTSNVGVGSEFLQFHNRACDLPNWFDVSRKFEIHAELRQSPKDLQLVPRELNNREFKIKWDEYKNCPDILISFPSRRIRIQMVPKFTGYKYGVDLLQYIKYMDEIEFQLNELLGYVPLKLLRVESFDLQQDHECKTYDEKYNRLLIYKMIGLQEYAIWREDRPEANHRKEANFLTSQGVGYASETQQVLAVEGAKIKALLDAGNLLKSADHAVRNMMTYQRDQLVEINKFGRDQTKYNIELLSKFDRFEEKQDNTLDTVDRSLQVIAGAAVDQARSAAATEAWSESVAQSVHATNQVLLEVSDILYELKEDQKEWREIDRGYKLEVLSRLKNLDLSFSDIHQQVSEYFDVTYQALYQFWNYWEDKFDQTELEKRSTKFGETFKKAGNDLDQTLVDEITSVVQSNPGIVTRKIVAKITGRDKIINDHIRWMRSAGILQIDRVKNSIQYHVPQGTDEKSSRKKGDEKI